MEDKVKKELTIIREFDAPIELVFSMWTDQKLLQQWWGPFGVTNPTCEFEAKVGGKIHIVMLAGEELGQLNGQEWPMTGIVKEIDRPQKLVYTSNAIVNGKEVLENLNTVTFEEVEGKTKMTLHIIVTKTTPEAAGPLSGMEMGYTQSIDKLSQFILKREEEK
jgi:uncharacterized protein YndB with AHSA1/START domain